jgi:hypothetical protein
MKKCCTCLRVRVFHMTLCTRSSYVRAIAMPLASSSSGRRWGCTRMSCDSGWTETARGIRLRLLRRWYSTSTCMDPPSAFVPTCSALFDVLPRAAVTPCNGYQEGAGAYREGEDYVTSGRYTGVEPEWRCECGSCEAVVDDED